MIKIKIVNIKKKCADTVNSAYLAIFGSKYNNL